MTTPSSAPAPSDDLTAYFRLDPRALAELRRWAVERALSMHSGGASAALREAAELEAYVLRGASCDGLHRPKWSLTPHADLHADGDVAVTGGAAAGGGVPAPHDGENDLALSRAVGRLAAQAEAARRHEDDLVERVVARLRLSPEAALASLPAAIERDLPGVLARPGPSAEGAEVETTPPLFDILCRRGLARSHGEARRLVRDGCVTIDGCVVLDEAHPTGIAARLELLRPSSAASPPGACL